MSRAGIGGPNVVNDSFRASDEVNGSFMTPWPGRQPIGNLTAVSSSETAHSRRCTATS